MLLKALRPDFYTLMSSLILNRDLEYLKIVKTMTRQQDIVTGVSLE